MFRPRVIPILLLKDGKLVNSVLFKKYTYIGDPINAVRLFNDLMVDELVILDISATKRGKSFSMELVHKLGDEAHMPFSVGGGINSIGVAREIFSAGAEKIVLNTSAYLDKKLVQELASLYGSSSITVCLDIKRFLGKPKVYSHSKAVGFSKDPVIMASEMEKLGAGELIVNSVDNDGKMSGYDNNLIKAISKATTLPIVASGGAGSLADMVAAINAGASAVAASSLFVYHGPRKAVLINYPSREDRTHAFNLIK